MTDDDVKPWNWDHRGEEEDFARQVRDRRLAKGWSQTEFAKRLSAHGLKFHQTTVARVEDGQRPLKLVEAMTIASVLGIAFESMLRQGPPDRESLLELENELREARWGLEDTVYEYGVKRRHLLESLDEADPGVLTPEEIERMRKACSLRAIRDYAEIRAMVRASVVSETPPRRVDVDET